MAGWLSTGSEKDREGWALYLHSLESKASFRCLAGFHRPAVPSPGGPGKDSK